MQTLPFTPIRAQQLTVGIADSELGTQKFGYNTPGTGSSGIPSANPVAPVNPITWTGRTASEASTWSAIAWSPSLALFVVVASAGTNRVMTSPDGITWTSRSASAANGWISVCWSAEQAVFVAVANSGTNRVMTSPDGITWTARTEAETNTWQQVIWAAGLSLFVAVSSDGTNRIMTSPTGVTWTSRTPSLNAWTSIAWSPTLSLLTIGVNLSAMAYSSDGTTWTDAAHTTTTATSRLVWDSTAAAFIGATGRSVDGKNWSQYGQPCQSARIISAPEAGVVLAFGANATVNTGYSTYAVSTDGLSWKAGYFPSGLGLGSGSMPGVYAPALGIFCIISQSTMNQIFTGVLNNTATITVYKDGGAGVAASNSFTNVGTTGKTLVLTATEMTADMIMVYYRYKNSKMVEVEDTLIIYTTPNELAAAPAASLSTAGKITAIFQYLMNRRTITASQEKMYKADGTTVLATGALSDNGTTYDKAAPS